MKHLRTKSELLAAADAGNWIAASFRAMMAAPKAEPEPVKPAAVIRPRRDWTETEDQVIRDGIASGRSSAAIGQALDRNPSTVSHRARSLGLRFQRFARADKFQPHEDRALIDGLAAGMTTEELLAAIPGRSRDSLQGRAWRLGIPFTPVYRRGKK